MIYLHSNKCSHILYRVTEGGAKMSDIQRNFYHLPMLSSPNFLCHLIYSPEARPPPPFFSFAFSFHVLSRYNGTLVYLACLNMPACSAISILGPYIIHVVVQGVFK